MKSRAFFGNCLPKFPSAVVWFQEELIKKGTWEKTVFLASVQAGKIKSEKLVKNLPPISAVLERTKQKNCQEIPGIEMFTEL